MKILCVGGGTAGHVYPVLAILDRLRFLCKRKGINVELEWLGRSRGISRRLVETEGIRHRQVFSGQIRAVNPLIQILSLIRVFFGTIQALWLVGKYKPDFCLATGGNAAAPGALASYLLRVPVLIFMPDAVPGVTDRLLIRIARKVFVANEGAMPHVKNKGEVTGYPVRENFLRASQSRHQARLALDESLGFDALTSIQQNGKCLPLLLVSGGSQGARSLNNAVLHCLNSILERCNLLLITGEGEFHSVAAQVESLILSPAKQSRLKIVPYLHAEFPQALAGADLAVLRSGASVLGELPVTCTPAVLVPLPGSGGHQWANACALSTQGACVVLDNAHLQERLWPTVESLLWNPEKRKGMESRLRKLARPDSALRSAKAILEAIQPSILTP